MLSPLFEAKQLPEASLVITGHRHAIDDSLRHCRVSKSLLHVCECRRVVRNLDDFIADVVTRKQDPYLLAIGAPRGLVENNAFTATRCLNGSRSKTQQRSG